MSKELILEKSGSKSRSAQSKTPEPVRLRSLPQTGNSPLMNLVQRRVIDGSPSGIGVAGRPLSLHQPGMHAVAMNLQSLGGNKYVNYLAGMGIQPTLMVGPVDDPYEREADTVAEQLMRMSNTRIQRCSACGGDEGDEYEEDESIQTKRFVNLTPLPGVQRKSSRNPFNRFLNHIKAAMPPADPRAGFQAGSEIKAKLSASRGGGSPLPEGFREKIEPKIGADLSEVSVHEGRAADEFCSLLNAEALTVGKDIFLKGNCSELVRAHELAHYVQQNPSARFDR